MKKVMVVFMILGVVFLLGCSKKKPGPDYEKIRHDSEKSWGEIR